MSATPSFHRLNYLLRPNKQIERRLLLESLARVSETVPLRNHRYLGFGSMWFGDFVLANRLLQIEEMWSLEHRPHAVRAEFNRPYANIAVVAGHSNRTLTSQNMAAWVKPLIAWLDYDGKLTVPIVSDIDSVLANGAPESMLIVTVNALWKAYRTRPGTTIEVIKELLHRDVIDPSFDPGKTGAGIQMDVTVAKFAEYLGSCLLNYMAHKVASSGRVANGQQLVFVPLANVCHVDGAEMITVGGVITTRPNANVWKDGFRPTLPLDVHGRPKHLRLDLAPISIKEKLAMDRCLPSAEPQFVQKTSQLGMGLSREERRKYRMYYRHFPVYAESVI